MRNLKKLVVVVTALSVMAAAGAVYAAPITPGEIVAGLADKTVEQVNDLRATGKTYGTIANDAGKLDEFKAQMLEQKKAILDQRVKDGIITQAQADAIYNNMKTNQSLCDGTGSGRMGNGVGFGMGRGQGTGYGMGRGQGGFGAGCGLNR